MSSRHFSLVFFFCFIVFRSINIFLIYKLYFYFLYFNIQFNSPMHFIWTQKFQLEPTGNILLKTEQNIYKYLVRSKIPLSKGTDPSSPELETLIQIDHTWSESDWSECPDLPYIHILVVCKMKKMWYRWYIRFKPSHPHNSNHF